MSAALLAPAPGEVEPNTAAEARRVLVVLSVAGQLCGLAVEHVRDVLGPQSITPIPLALPDIAGNLNLRGKIVTAISLRRRLGLPLLETEASCMSIVAEQGAELYALLVDQVVDVLTLSVLETTRLPPTLAPAWQRFSAGVHCLTDRLIIILDLGCLLDFTSSET